MGTEVVAKLIIGAGAVLVLVGGAMLLLGKLGIHLGQLPGDMNLDGERSSFHFPLMSCLILSVVLTVILNVVIRLWK